MSAKSTAKVRMPIISATSPSRAKTVSRVFDLLMIVFRSVGFTEAFAEEMAADVAGEREEHQRQAGGEDGLVADRAVRQVAQRHLHDVGGDGRRGLERIEGQ